MIRCCNLILFLLCTTTAIAQLPVLTPDEKAVLDSMLNEDEFLKMMTEKEKNYFDLSIGIGNGLFSTHNNAQNATGVANRLIYTPAIAYHHKSGFSVSINPFLLNDTGKIILYQAGIGISYDHYGEKMKWGVAYTKYISDEKKYNSNALYQNDLYGYIKKAKGLIIPGIALGYSSGKYKQIDDVQFPNTIRKDSTVNEATYFSVTASAGHEFTCYKIFTASDELDITTSLLLNAGSDKIITTHLNKIFDRRILNKKKRMETNNNFQVQSIAAAVTFMYGIGKWYVQPNLYVDYYLPATNSNRWSSLFSLTAGINF